MRVPRLISRSFAFVALASSALLVQSCRDAGPVAPPVASIQSSANLDLLGGTLSTLSKVGNLVNALTCSRLPAYSAGALIGKDGGTIQVGPHEVTIPRGALSGPVYITATSPSEKVARVTLQPHGLQFDKPATLTMSYAHCTVVSSLLPKKIAYVQGGTLELINYLPSLDNLLQKEVSAKLDHFSDYVLSW
jgi:hypothetical protein